ncbi:MAG: Smr/MutS family protein, partial [Oscillospiraceae bacterium]|nr:Smr/MutS family protein [Oscillospiraceae bacterium]
LALDAVCPELNDEGIIELKKARHPLIPKGKVVPIDLELGGAFRQLVITGPNTGGKTVTLKTAGLLTLMAASGIPVPAKEGSRLAVFESVLADIGDEQSIEQSLSTFSAHMSNIAEILREAGGGSLVLLDELGAGTDPAEGAALAVAILERLRSLESLVLATTHYGEIKLYALETEGVQNASCEFDVKTLRPTYRLNIGIPGRSNALLIAERLGLDEELLESARRGMSSQDRRFEDMMSEIEELKSGISEKEREIEGLRESAALELEDAKKRGQKLLEQGQRELEAARLKAKQLSADVAADAYRLLDEIKKLDASKDKDRAAAKARAKAIATRDAQKLGEVEGAEADFLAETLEPIESAAVGDRVYIVALAQAGVVTAEADNKGAYEVKAGNIKIRVKPEGLRRAPAAAQPKRQAAVSSGAARSVSEQRSGRNEINLIGMNVEEALQETDRFIDMALLSHLGQVYIIHGKGTGTLRAAIHKHLKGIKRVASFRLGTFGEGEAGVTVVELK